MKYFKIVVVTLFIVSGNLCAQNTDISKLMVGFTCGFGGKPTTLVTDMTTLIKEKKYPQIVSLLNSKNSGEVFLAVITIDRITTLGLYTLSKEENLLISKVKLTPYLIYFCSGCMPDQKTMKELLLSQENNGAKEWLDKAIGIK